MGVRKDLLQVGDVQCVQMNRLNGLNRYTYMSPFEFLHAFFIAVIDRVIE